MRSGRGSRLAVPVLAAVALCAATRAAEPVGKREGPVYWIPIDDGPEAVPGGMMDRVTVAFVRKQVDEAKKANASVIVFHIKTFGGDSKAMIYIAKAIREARPIPTVAFVDDWALSAGALIAIACDTIYMENLSTMGAAQGILLGKDGTVQTAPEKFASVFRAFFRAEVERRASKAEFPESVTAIAEAMTDPEVEVLLVDIEGTERFVRRSQLTGKEEDGFTFGGKSVKVRRTAVAKGRLLTMTAKEAYETYKFIDGIVAGREEVLERIGHRETPILVVEKSWPEEIARFLSGAMLSSLLISLAMLGLLMAFYAPGKSVGGLVFLFAMGLFFWSHAEAGEAGPIEIVLFLLGFALLAAEAFLIPGFGVAGIAGIGLIVTSLVLAFIPEGAFATGADGMPFPTEQLRNALLAILAGVGLAAVVVLILGRFLPRAPFFNRIVLAARSAGGEAGAEGATAASAMGRFVGKRGLAATDLRPAGKVEVGGELIDAVTEAEFLGLGDVVEVLEASGNRVVVSGAGAIARTRPPEGNKAARDTTADESEAGQGDEQGKSEGGAA